MENLQRRPNGIYVARLTVPARLRQLIGKRELISSTGTQNLVIAKLVASARLAQWRRQLFDLDRLALVGTTSMNHESVLKIADGHPFLRGGGHLPLNMAAGALGLTASDVLRMEPNGPLSVFFRAAGARGYLVPLDALETDFPTPGARVIPSRAFMPAGAVDFVADGLLIVKQHRNASSRNEHSGFHVPFHCVSGYVTPCQRISHSARLSRRRLYKCSEGMANTSAVVLVVDWIAGGGGGSQLFLRRYKPIQVHGFGLLAISAVRPQWPATPRSSCILVRAIQGLKPLFLWRR